MNGVDVERFTPGPKDQELTERFGLGEKKVLLTVGRVEKRKGHDMVIQALPEILREIPETVYMVVGVGSDLNRIKSLARELNVTDQVIFVGRVSDEDLPRYYNTADIFVMPNRTLDNNDTEGFGLVFLEANACSKPVVGGNAGGVPDAIVDGETGILVDGKSIKAVAIAVINLLKNENLVFQIGESGRKRALTFDWKKKAQEFYAVCEKIVQR
jgi:phosphatidylinositol alpha-1,6-mannosyltransferase